MDGEPWAEDASEANQWPAAGTGAAVVDAAAAVGRTPVDVVGPAGAVVAGVGRLPGGH